MVGAAGGRRAFSGDSAIERRGGSAGVPRVPERGGRRPRGDEREGKSEMCGGFWCRDSQIKESHCGFADSPGKEKNRPTPVPPGETVDEE